MNNVYDNPAYKQVKEMMYQKLVKVKKRYQDPVEIPVIL